jgi:hypothetical protein
VNAQSKVMIGDAGNRCNIMPFKSAPELAKLSWVSPDPDPRALLRAMVVGGLDLFHDAQTGIYRFRKGERTFAIASSIQTKDAQKRMVSATCPPRKVAALVAARNSLMAISES